MERESWNLFCFTETSCSLGHNLSVTLLSLPLCITLLHQERALKLQSPKQLDTSCSSSLSGGGKEYTHACTWRRHTHIHTPAILCHPLHWQSMGKSSLRHSANYLPLSPPLSFPPHTVFFSSSAFSRKVLTSNLSFLPRFSLWAALQRAIMSNFFFSYLSLS